MNSDFLFWHNNGTKTPKMILYFKTNLLICLENFLFVLKLNPKHLQLEMKETANILTEMFVRNHLVESHKRWSKIEWRSLCWVCLCCPKYKCLLNLPMVFLPMVFKIQRPVGALEVLGVFSHYNFDWVISPAFWQSDLRCSDYSL